MKTKKVITKQQINCIIEKYRIKLDTKNITITEQGLIDIAGDVSITNSKLKKLPLSFGRVTGNFHCSSNQLISLKGCPVFVGGSFNCFGNQLNSLKYSPKEVGGDFSCHQNLLTSLKGSPKHILGNFNAFLNQLTSLEGSAERIEGNFYIHQNELKSLKFAPVHIGKSFYVTGNLLDDLVGCPEYIGDTLTFDNDVKLYLGNRNCIVKKVIIQEQEAIPASVKTISPVVVSNQRFLPIVFKYIRYLDFYEDGSFNENYFNEVILDIKEGLR